MGRDRKVDGCMMLVRLCVFKRELACRELKKGWRMRRGNDHVENGVI